MENSKNQETKLVFSSVWLKLSIPVLAGFITGITFVYLVSWDRCDLYTIITVSLFASYAMLYVIQVLLGSSGVLALIVFGIVICCTKLKIAKELEHSLVQFWMLVSDIINVFLYVGSGVLMVYASMSFGDKSDFVRIFMTYFICLIARSTTFLILTPILKRLGYGFAWKNGVILAWGALKGTGTLLLAACMYLDTNKLGEFSKKAMIYAVGLVLLQILINGSLVKKTVELLGLSNVSILKISNMNNIITHMESARDRSINMLKTNKLYADAAWEVVRKATKIIHPYEGLMAKEGDFNRGEEYDYNYSSCPDCKKEIPHQPTSKELQEIRKEAHLRILKAKKVSYWRQFEWGLMSQEANRTLVGNVNDALENNDKEVADADALKKMWKPKGCKVFIRDKLLNFLPKEGFAIECKSPLKRWQNFFFCVTNSLWWEYGIFLLISLDIISIILDFVYRPTFENHEEVILLSISTIFLALLLLQCFFQLMGMGWFNFFRSPWNLIDMITFIITVFYVYGVYGNYFSFEGKKLNNVALLSLSASRSIYALRFCRIYQIFRASIPKVVAYLDKKIDVQLAHSYDVGKGFVTGESEVLKLLPRIVNDPHILTEIKLKIESDRLAIMREIGILQRNRPGVVITVKTREAMAAVFHVMRVTVKDLKDEGLLDDEEYELLRRAIDERQKHARKRYLNISPCPPEELLQQVSWLIDDQESANFLITHSLMVNLNFEEILIRTDEEPQGIYIIVSGMVKMKYIPNIKKLQKLEKCGTLPNVDYPISINYREHQEDYIVSGNVVGEIGILTGRTYDTCITCASSVQAYFISIDVMNYIMKTQADNNALEQRIWKAVAMRIACILLPAVPMYQSWTQEKLQIYLERSIVPKLNTTKTFILNELMEAVLLIEGRTLDVINRDVYFGPSYIPRTVRKLTFADITNESECKNQPILLIIPTEDVDEEELLNFVEGDNDWISVDSESVGLKPETQSAHYSRKERRRKMNKLGFNKTETRNRVKATRTETVLSERLQFGSDLSGKILSDRDDEILEELEDENNMKKEEEKESEIRRRHLSTKFSRSVNEDFGREFEKDTPKMSSSEASDDEKESKSYIFSYFNYQPMYEFDFQDESEEALRDFVDSVPVEQVPSSDQIHPTTENFAGESSRTASEEEYQEDPSNRIESRSSENEGQVLNAIRNKFRSWF